MTSAPVFHKVPDTSPEVTAQEAKPKEVKRF